jgi:hypothetical protein
MIVTEEMTRGATKNTLVWISYLLTVTTVRRKHVVVPIDNRSVAPTPFRVRATADY